MNMDNRNKRIDSHNNFVPHYVDPINSVIRRSLIDVLYADTNGKQLINSNNNVHVISHQLQLVFNNSKKLVISWLFGEGIESYVIGCSSSSFFNEVPHEYSMADDEHWKSFVNTTLEKWSLWGLKTTEGKCKTEGLFNKQTYLIKLGFTNRKSISITNFYAEKDFKPKAFGGDDLWILFDTDMAEMIVNRFEFQEIYSSE